MTDGKLIDEQVEAIGQALDVIRDAVKLLETAIGEERKEHRKLLPEVTTPTQRAGLVGWLLGLGVEMTTSQVANICGFSQRAARDLMSQLGEVLPIEREGWRWKVKTAE